MLLIQAGWAALADVWTSPSHLVGFAVTVLIGAAHVIVMPGWRYRVHRREISDDAVYTCSGWFTQESRSPRSHGSSPLTRAAASCSA